MQISQKQQKLADVVKFRQASEIFLIGSIGTSKTFGMAFVLANLAYQFPKSVIPIGRHSVTEARLSTYLSFLKVFDAMGLKQFTDYTIRGAPDLSFTFANGSYMFFVPLDITKDRDWNRIKGIEATAAGVDEVDSIDETGYDTLFSRTGRNNDNGAPAVIISTCNPNDGWIKSRIYEPYRAGRLPTGVMVIEFDLQDSFLFASGYYERFMNRPYAWQQRYLFNNWNYLDDDKSLFKMRLLDSIGVERLKPGTRYLGVDVAREGKDRSTLCLYQDDILTDIRIYTREDLDRLAEPHERAAPPYSDILAREIINYAQEEQIGYENIGVDGVGNGAGVVDALRLRGWPVQVFKSGARPEKGAKEEGEYASFEYDMLRSQVLHAMALAMERGQYHIYYGCPFVSDLKKELTLHQAETDAKSFRVESKDELKRRLGQSPDIADGALIGFWVKMKATNLPDPAATPTIGKRFYDGYNNFEG